MNNLDPEWELNIRRDERNKITNYLLEMNVLRNAIFYEGYVAFNTEGTNAMDLPVNLGGTE
jgi:hypothetical protein